MTNLATRIVRMFNGSARARYYEGITTPPADDGIQGDWAMLLTPTGLSLFGPKTDDATWPAAIPSGSGAGAVDQGDGTFIISGLQAYLSSRVDALFVNARNNIVDPATNKLRTELLPNTTNAQPTAAFTKTVALLKVTFDGTSSTDSDGSISAWAWNFGDGTTGTGPTTSRTYTAAGTYTVKLTVTDNVGATATATQTVTVVASGNTPPTASFTLIKSGLLVNVDASASTDSGGSIASYVWNWGDSSTNSTGVTASHTYTAAGTYTQTLTVTDNGGATATATKSTIITAPTGTGITPIATDGRWWIVNTAAPQVETRWDTLYAGSTAVKWVGSMPDAAARATPRTMGVALKTQQAFQVQVSRVNGSTLTLVHDSGIVTSAAETYTVPVALVAGAVYSTIVRVQDSTSVWSAYSYPIRSVVPSGVVRYVEDYGCVPDGVTRSGTDYGASPAIYTGPFRDAIRACAYGDVLKSRKQGTIVNAAVVSGTNVTKANAFNSGMVGKKVVIYGAGKTDASATYAFYTTVTAATTGSLTLAAAVLTNGTWNLMVDYAEYLVGHIDNDSGAGITGGVTIDMTGCILTSKDANYAGFRTTLPDMTYVGIHYRSDNVTIRGNGKNNQDGHQFIESSTAVGYRCIDGYSEHARDAAWLFYNSPSDCHVVRCIDDHSLADAFHVTGSAHHIYFWDITGIYVGDDMCAMIGYRTNGDANRPHDIKYIRPTLMGQDWGRGVSFGGVYNAMVQGLTDTGDALATFLMGSDGDQANSTNCQVRDFVIKSPSSRRGLKPTYSQGASTTSVVPDDPWLKWIASSSGPTQQSYLLLENGQVTDGRFIQVISYGTGTAAGVFKDLTIVGRSIALLGDTNSGTNWRDENTYPNRIDWRGFDVSGATGTTNVTTAPSLAGTGTGA